MSKIIYAARSDLASTRTEVGVLGATKGDAQWPAGAANAAVTQQLTTGVESAVAPQQLTAVEKAAETPQQQLT